MSCPHGNRPDGCERCAEIADHERAYELLFTENAKLRSEVERLAAQAASAPAVRMLTEDEVAQAAEDGERSFRRWTQGVRGQTLMPQDSPTFHYVMAGAAKALAVNAGKHIPADGKIGGV